MANQGKSNDGGDAKVEAKRQRRAERKAAEQKAAEQQARRRTIRNAVVVGGVVVIGVALAFAAFRPGPELEGVERLSSDGRDHLGPSATYDYGIDAPTSGPHRETQPRCGIFPEPVDLEIAVHALEHGAVVLWYRPDVDADVVDGLREVALAHDSHVVVSPNPRLDDDEVVATAWNRRARYSDGTDPQIAEFVDTYRRRGPESVDCPI